MLIPNGASELRDGLTYGLTGDPDVGPTAPNLPSRTQDTIVAALKSTHFDPSSGTSAWPGVGAQLYAGLRRGIPLPLAILEAAIQNAMNDVTLTFDHIGDALAAFIAQFGTKWTGIDDAQAAAAYALAQLAVKGRPIVDLFDGAAGSPSANWDVFHTGGGGSFHIDGNGHLVYARSGGVAASERMRWNAADTATDYQVISTVMSTRVQSASAGADSFSYLCGRVNSAFDTFVVGRAESGGAAVGCFNSGTPTIFVSNPVTVGAGDSWDFYVGDPVAPDPYRFLLIRNGVPVVNYTDSAMVSQKGSGYRSVGIRVFVADRNLGTSQTSPGSFVVFSADDQ